MDHVIAYASQTLSKSEKNYDARKLEFLALKWSVNERFHEHLYGEYFEVYTDNNPLTYILTTAKLDATGQRWVTSLANYNFTIFYRSGKLIGGGRCLIMDPMGKYTGGLCRTFDCENMLQSKLVTEVGVPDVHPQFNVIQKSMVVDSSPKLTHDEWVKEQSEDSDIGL